MSAGQEALGATSEGGPFRSSGYAWNEASEGAAVDKSAKEAIDSWMSGQEITKFVLDGQLRAVEYGIGVARDDRGKLYWSFVVATPR